jgi:O-acetylhomoserine (thiol)-lyase
MKIETKCIQEGYKPENGQPRVLPIFQSTTYKYDSAEQVGRLFDLEETGHFYSRLSNPTVEAVEKKIAALEGGVGALCTISGQAATMLSVLNILSAGDHLVSAASVYGGTVNLFGVTLQRLGIEVTFVDQQDEAAVRKAFRKNTKALFGETIANPALTVLDIEKMAKIAHENGVPLIVDNTFATPVLCRPIEFGADIVTHSTSKYMDGHAVQLGGVIVDSGKFDWTNGKFSGLTEPDESYHGVSYTKTFGSAAYLSKARLQLVRDMGVYPPATAAFLLNLGLETLALRMKRHSENALRTAEFLLTSEKIAFVNYPGLPGNPYYDLAKKYVPGGSSGVVSFEVKGGRSAAMRFLNSLKLAAIVVHVADARTSVLHPASSTHRQLTDEQLAAGGITPGLVRMSVGIENIDDIIEDLKQALLNV